ncbi:MAG: hypothetical protein H7175_10040, partial [Burkholderiales bacterium]|nr:hypothetical protein [Anaerolineae bacterium]
MQKAQLANEFTLGTVEETQTRWWERSWVIPAGLALLAFLLYANTIDGHFFYSWDDNRYVTENMLMRDLSPQGVYTMFSQFYFAAYIPMTILSYAIDYRIWGLDPTGYHLMNVILNAVNAALVYIFLKRLLNNRGVALIAALLFTVHPLQVESVAWVAERKNLLSLFFMLLSFLAHMRSARDDAPAYALPLACFWFMLSVLTKPVVVGAPILFMAYDYYWAHMPLKRVILRSIAPWIIGIAGAALIMIAHEDYGGIKEHRGGSLFGTAQVMLVVFWDYVVSFFNPTNLDNRYYYPISIITTEAYKVWLGAAVVVFMGLFAWFQPLGKPFSRYAVLWVGVFMAPVINIVPIAIERTDRYMYYPSIVIFALVGILFMKL